MDGIERLFWSLAIFFGMHFIWLGLIEKHIPMIVGTVIAAVLGLSFFFRGYRWFEPREASGQ